MTDPTTKFEIAGHHRRKELAATHRRTRFARSSCRPSVLLIPDLLRIKGHYVNHSVRGFLPPARWRFSSPRFDPPRLRMPHIIRPRVVVPAIPSAPVAAHSIASMLYEVSRPSGTFLIPDCAQAEHPNPRSSGSGQRSRAQCWSDRGLTHVAIPVQRAALHQDPTDRIAIIKRSNLHGTYR